MRESDELLSCATRVSIRVYQRKSDSYTRTLSNYPAERVILCCAKFWEAEVDSSRLGDFGCSDHDFVRTLRVMDPKT